MIQNGAEQAVLINLNVINRLLKSRRKIRAIITVLRKLRIMRALKTVNCLTLRLRRQLLAFARRLHTSGERRLKAVLPRAGAKINTAHIVDTTVHSRKPSTTLPSCHPDHKSVRKTFKGPILLPAFDYDPPQPQSFALFATFPAELRLMVWHFACFRQRVVEIQWVNRDKGFDDSCSLWHPAVLHVCRESRQEALKIYKLWRRLRDRTKSLYVNIASDIILFRSIESPRAWQYTTTYHLWHDQVLSVWRMALTCSSENVLRYLKWRL